MGQKKYVFITTVDIKICAGMHLLYIGVNEKIGTHYKISRIKPFCDAKECY
jgi:hypothetical protein